MIDQQMTYEAAKQELSSIVSRLQAGNLTLDESITLFTRGKQLSKFCLDKLNETEAKITKVISLSEDNIAEENFIPNEQ
ncbi:MAG: exodeoxyribonuclease VII small subunit [Clostridia bacterium]|nr:exodeoxyribonuclease VII small subunit [Clostridia bacterium]